MTDKCIKIPFKYSDIDEVMTTIDYSKELMFDTETDGLYGEIVVAQLYQEGWDKVLLIKDPEPSYLVVVLNKSVSVMQSANYDLSVLQVQTSSSFIPKKFIDLLYLARLFFYKEPNFSLDKIFKYTLGYDPYVDQNLKKAELQKSKFKRGLELTPEQEIYCSIDVYYMPDVLNKTKDHLKDTNYKLDMKALRAALSMQKHGMPVDEKRRAEQWEVNNTIIVEADMPLNVGSWQQVRKYINEEESDDLALAKFSFAGNEKAKEVRRVKKIVKENSFLNNYRSENNIIKGFFAPTTRSGRFACSGIKGEWKEGTENYQNLQQLHGKTKRVFGYPEDDGRIIIYSDFSQIQLRIVCAVVNEKRMADLYFNDQDVHNYTRDEIHWLSELEDGRKIAKTCNFNLLFKGSAGMLGSILVKKADVWLPEDTLYRLKSNWLKLWPTIAKWQDAGVTAWQVGKAWQTPLGRRYVGKLMTDQLAIQIQGTEADIAKLAFIRILDRIKGMKDVKMRDFVHDNYILSCPNDETVYGEVAQIVAESMQSSWVEVSQYFKIKDLPMPVDVAVGYNWGDIENDDIDNIWNLKVS